MKILLVNKFYYPRGGDCIYTLELEKLLKSKGHEIACFSMQHSQNLPSPWARFFPKEVDFSKLSIKSLYEFFFRPFGTKEVKHKFSQLLLNFKPDIVHLNNIHTQLSPILAELAYNKGIKVIWTLHDYKLLCPRYDCLRNGTTPCEACFTNKVNVIKYTCMKNNRLASILAYLEAKKWTKDKLKKYTSNFICPSRFMKEKMQQGGFDPQKLTLLHNFIDLSKAKTEYYEKSDYYCYVGRLSPEKGVETLLRAALSFPYKLKVIGGGPLLEMLKTTYNTPQIEFLGHLAWEQLKPLINQAKFCVLPSECYENNPLSAIESLALGTPLLGANIGGIPELVKDGFNGFVFESGNVEDLKEKLNKIYHYQLFSYSQIAEDCKAFSSEFYYKKLKSIYGF